MSGLGGLLPGGARGGLTFIPTTILAVRVCRLASDACRCRTWTSGTTIPTNATPLLNTPAAATIYQPPMRLTFPLPTTHLAFAMCPASSNVTAISHSTAAATFSSMPIDRHSDSLVLSDALQYLRYRTL